MHDICMRLVNVGIVIIRRILMEDVYVGNVCVGGILVRVIIIGVIKVVGAVAKWNVNVGVVIMGGVQV